MIIQLRRLRQLAGEQVQLCSAIAWVKRTFRSAYVVYEKLISIHGYGIKPKSDQ